MRGHGEAARGGWTARAAVLLAAATFSLWAGFGGTYHFDDDAAVRCDPASQGLVGWADRLGKTLRPATKLTYALEATLGLGASGRRAVSAALQAAGAVALLLLLLRVSGSGSGSASPPPPLTVAAAASVALLWSVHPVHAEAVLAVAGRSAVLSGTLLLWALVAQLADRRVTAAVLLLVAGLSRETAWAGLVAIGVAELSFAGPRRLAEHARRLGPAALAALVVALLVAIVPRYRALADYSMHGRPWLESVVRQVAAVPHGLSLYGRPWALSVDHGEALPGSPASAAFLLGLGLFAAALTTIVLTVRRRPAVALGLALWLVAILPTQSIIPKLDALTERPLCLALAGLLLAVWAMLPAYRSSHAPRAEVPRRPGMPRALVGATAAVLAAWLGAATLARGALYRSDVALWSDAADKSATNPRPHLNLAVAFLEAGEPARAALALAPARAIDPIDPRLAALTLRVAETEQERSP